MSNLDRKIPNLTACIDSVAMGAEQGFEPDESRLFEGILRSASSSWLRLHRCCPAGEIDTNNIPA